MEGQKGNEPQWSDEALARIIRDARETRGSCSFGHLVRVTGQSKTAIVSRMNTMRRRGLVTWEPYVHGSLRTTDEATYRRPR